MTRVTLFPRSKGVTIADQVCTCTVRVQVKYAYFPLLVPLTLVCSYVLCSWGALIRFCQRSERIWLNFIVRCGLADTFSWRNFLASSSSNLFEQKWIARFCLRSVTRDGPEYGGRHVCHSQKCTLSILLDLSDIASERWDPNTNMSTKMPRFVCGLIRNTETSCISSQHPKQVLTVCDIWRLRSVRFFLLPSSCPPCGSHK